MNLVTGRRVGPYEDEEALAVLLSIPGPVLPELVEANTAFALLRLGNEKTRGSTSDEHSASTRTIRAAASPVLRRYCWRSQSPSKHRR